MKTALVVFNGIQFPFYVVQHSISWAKKNDAGLYGLFVHSGKEPSEGYIFPSDIDPAENLYSKEDAEKSNERVIHSQVKLFHNMVADEHIPVQTKELISPSLEEMIAITKGADILFIDTDYDKSYLLANDSFRFKNLFERSHCPVEMVSEQK